MEDLENEVSNIHVDLARGAPPHLGASAISSTAVALKTLCATPDPLHQTFI